MKDVNCIDCGHTTCSLAGMHDIIQCKDFVQKEVKPASVNCQQCTHSYCTFAGIDRDCICDNLELVDTPSPADIDHPPVQLAKASDLQVGGQHYKDMAIQPAHFNQVNKLDWCEANIVKYACRHGVKNGAEDVRKIIHYAKLLLEWTYNEKE